MRSQATWPCAALFAVGVAFVGSACFDAHQVDPGVLMLDDFDHGPFPADSTFMPWMCFSFNPNGQMFSCADDGDTPDGSEYSLRLDFTVADPVNGVRDWGGAGLVTYAPFGLYRDVTVFATLGFDARVQSGIPVLPNTATFNIVFGCSTLVDGTAPENLYVVQDWNYDISGQWSHGTVSFANFGRPNNTELNVADCLRRVDQIAFQLAPNLPDGGSARGTLNIDNIYFK
jgi:hypothetical protein